MEAKAFQNIKLFAAHFKIFTFVHFPGYGLTETSPLVTVCPKGHKATAETGGTIGKVLPNTAAKFISIGDDSGNIFIIFTLYVSASFLRSCWESYYD